MADVRRGIVRSFDTGTYRASLQLDDSRSSFAVSVPVSRGIPAADMVVGRMCVVVLLTADDVGDAMVVGVHG